MKSVEIINCHIHTFTINDVPEKFFPPYLRFLLKPNFIRQPLMWILKNLWPFTDRDILDRYVNFLEIANKESQEKIFDAITACYPSKTRFVILPMDMEYMFEKQLKAKSDYIKQLKELSKLKKNNSEKIFPFIAVDPRRVGIFKLVKQYIEKHSFCGIKIYPRLGFYPNDCVLYEIYCYAQEKEIPILSHCSRGGIHTRKVTESMLNHPIRGKIKKTNPKDFSHNFTEPSNYEPILTDFPNLKICLAHFGGNKEWDRYLENREDQGKKNSWVSKIIELMERYNNLYTDISYTIFSSGRYFPLLDILLENDRINKKIMFGSDYYMVKKEKFSEKEISLKLRSHLGYDKFKMIAETNVKEFLGIPKYRLQN